MPWLKTLVPKWINRINSNKHDFLDTLWLLLPNTCCPIWICRPKQIDIFHCLNSLPLMLPAEVNFQRKTAFLFYSIHSKNILLALIALAILWNKLMTLFSKSGKYLGPFLVKIESSNFMQFCTFQFWHTWTMLCTIAHHFPFICLYPKPILLYVLLQFNLMCIYLTPIFYHVYICSSWFFL